MKRVSRFPNLERRLQRRSDSVLQWLYNCFLFLFSFLLLCIWILLLTSCAQYQDATTLIKERGAQVNDTLLADSEFFLCYGASVGSIQRRYNTAELAQAWHSLCRQNSEWSLDD